VPAIFIRGAVAFGGWACLVDPRSHAVLAVKFCALATRALAACSRLRTLTAEMRRGAPVSGNPARHRPEFAMSLSSTSFADAVVALLVRDVDGQYRPARADEVLSQARRVLSQRVRRGATMSSLQAVKDFLRVEIGALPLQRDLALEDGMTCRVVSLPAARDATDDTVVDGGPVVHCGRIAEVDERQRVVGLYHLASVATRVSVASGGTGKIGGNQRPRRRRNEPFRIAGGPAPLRR
jgi:hypothetical protein